jgi:cation:H+ antiporter
MTTQPLDPDSHGWRQPVAVAAACAVLGLLILPAGGALPAPIAMIGLGAALVGASLLLSWAADAAEVEISGGMVLAGITLVTVLPELIVEVHFAYTQQTSLVSANRTCATRLLLTGATAMPVLGAWLLARRGQQAPSAAYRLAPARRVDLAVLFVAAVYGILLALLGRISLVDGFLLVALYLFYVRRIGGTPDEPPAVVGVSAGLAALPPQQRGCWRCRRSWWGRSPFPSPTRSKRPAPRSESIPTSSFSRSCPGRPRHPNS